MRGRQRVSGFVALLCLSVGIRVAADPAVLVLHSYHKAAWSDSVLAGMDSVLSDVPGLNLYVEYMGTKQCNTPAYLELLAQEYRIKYDGLQFDVILVSDDNALRFALAHHRSLFHDAPVVFCGVNDYTPELLRDHSNVTGVVEHGDFLATLRSAGTLCPDAKQIYAICDGTPTGQINRRSFEAVLTANFPALSCSYLQDLSVAELGRRLASLPDDSFALFISFWQDVDGTLVPPETLGALFQQSTRPVFGRSEWMLGRGLVGGKCVSGFHQGEAAARLARRVLDGESTAQMPVILDSPNKFMFDYQELSRFDLPTRLLPDDTILLNRPDPLLKISRELATFITGATVLLLALLVALSIDVLRRRRAERRLQASEQRFRSLFEQALDGILVFQDDGVILEANEEMGRILGKDPAHLPGMSMTDLDPGWSVDRSGPAGTVATSPPYEVSYGGHAGTVPVQVREGRMISQGRVVGVAHIRDVTERNRARAQERALSERLERTQRLQSLGLLAGGVAHDLNNMFSPIVALPQLLEEDIDAVAHGRTDLVAGLHDGLQTIQAAAIRAADTIRDLLLFAQRVSIHKMPLSTSAMVREVFALPEFEALRSPGRGVPLEVCDEDLPVEGSKSHLLRAVSNLLRNAMEAADHDGQIDVTVDHTHLDEAWRGYETIPPGDYAVIRVRNEGEPIPEKRLGRIFEPFYSRKGATKGSGSGLGLAIVHGVAKDHAGFVDVTSGPGIPTCFSIYLPLLSATSDPEAPAAQDVPVAPLAAQGAGQRILVVDDEPSQLLVATRIFQRDGFDVATAGSGTEALALIDKHEGPDAPFDIVVMDVIMEEHLDGIETIRRIRSRFPDQKVLLASGFMQERHIIRARELGLHWLSTPFAPDALMKAVSDVIDEGNGQPAGCQGA